MINMNFERVDADLVSKASSFPASILADVAGRRGTLDGAICGLSPSMRVYGPAFTVEVRPGDNLMIHAALALAKAGDVIVVDGKGDTSCALCGELMSAQAKAAGIAGLVIDGAVRDALALRSGDFPVFSRGTNPNGPTKGLAGRIGYPISVAGVAVCPGDLIAGDEDGVVVIPRSDLGALLLEAQRKVVKERQRLIDIGDGELVQAWVEKALRQVGAIKADAALSDLRS